MNMLKKKIKKAIIPVAGLGTRMFPATKSIPKEMLPLADKPIIQYIINECIWSGIKEIILITNSFKNSIEKYIHSTVKKEKSFKKKNIKNNEKKCKNYITITSVTQNVTKGLGHAILCAKSLIGKEPFAILLPDVIINQHYSNLKNHNLKEMLDIYHKKSISQILVKPIHKKYISNYGIVDCGKFNLKPGKTKIIQNIIEKPKINESPSNLSIVGRYVLSEKIWPFLEKVSHKTKKEIQLTDAIKMLIKKTPIEAYLLKGKSHDCGNKLGYMKAFVEYSIKHKTFGKKFYKWIKKIK